MIPNKSTFKFQELTPITGVKPYVIRFWETEFPEISPVSSEGGQKLYSRSDIEAILRIKKLLFEDKLSIPEAKMKLSTDEAAPVFAEASEYSNDVSRVDVRPYLEDSLQFIRELKIKRNW